MFNKGTDRGIGRVLRTHEREDDAWDESPTSANSIGRAQKMSDCMMVGLRECWCLMGVTVAEHVPAPDE